MSHVIDDLANRNALRLVAAWAEEHPDAPMPLEQVRRIACGNASTVDTNYYGEQWTKSLISLVQRSGVGCLERDQDGRLRLRFTQPLPDVEAAWSFAYWDGVPPVQREVGRT
jgi:hypothetical protein